MIMFAILFSLLLALAGMLLVLPARRRGRRGAITRDALNTEFYQRRLQELTQDEAQGLVDERPLHIEELQHNLLADIPSRQPAAQRPLTLWTLAPGVVALVVMTLGLYAWTGAAPQVWRWQRAVAEMPALRARIMA